MRRLGTRMVTSPSVATWGSFAARALPLVVLPGFVFRAFSEELAALWFVLITIQGLQLLLESNVGLTFIRAIGFALGGATQLRDQSRPERSELSGCMNVGLLSDVWAAMRRLYMWVGGLTLLLTGTAAYYSASGLVARLENPVEGWGALAVFVVGAALRAYGGLHISYLYGIGRIVMLRWWEMFFWLLSFAFASAALWTGMSLLVVALVYQLPLLVNLVLNAILTRREQKGCVGFQASGCDAEEVIRQLWPALWRSGLGVALYLGATQGAGLLYARIGPPSEVAVYLFAMSLMRPMIQFAQVPFFTKLPLLAALQAAGDRDTLVAVAQRGMRLSHIALAATICVSAALLPMIEAIGGAAAKVPLLLWASIGLAAFLERLGGMHLQLYSQTNHIVWHWANGGAAVAFIFGALFLLPAFGVLAFPLALAAACFIYYVPYCLYCSYQAFELSWRFELKVSVLPLVVVLGLQVGATLIW